MNIILTLSPQIQADLERLAAAEGIDLHSFLLDVVQESLNYREPEPARSGSYDEWGTRFRAWIDGHRLRNPGVDDRRESIYD